LTNQSHDEFNSPTFESEVVVEGIHAGKGMGYSKKESQQIAAHETWNKIKKDSAFMESILAAKALRENPEGEEVPQEVEIHEDLTHEVTFEAVRRSDEAERIISEAEEAAFRELEE